MRIDPQFFSKNTFIAACKRTWSQHYS